MTALPAAPCQPQGNSSRPISPTCSEALGGSGHGKVARTFHGPLGFADLSRNREASSKGPLEKGAGEQQGLRCCWRDSVHFWAARQETLQIVSELLI